MKLRKCACGVTAFVFARPFFLCRGSGDITCDFAEQRQRKSYKLHALLIEIAFPDTYAALSEPVLFARIKYYLSFVSFCKKYLVRYGYTCRFDSSNAIIDDFFWCRGSNSVGSSSMHVQIVSICLSGTSNGKTYTL